MLSKVKWISAVVSAAMVLAFGGMLVYVGVPHFMAGAMAGFFFVLIYQDFEE